MIAPLFALLLQASHPPVVHVSLDSRGPLARGRPVRVYVDLTQDGNLVVLHRRTDGRIEVLFPSQPGSNPFVKAGSYEIRGDDTRSAWVVAEPDGTGMVLAALTPDPLRVDEFVRAADWNPDALVASWSGADGEGAMSDVVQRMLGDGYFNYDVVSYTVAPSVYAGLDQDVAPPQAEDSSTAYAQTPPYPQCFDCTFIGEQVIIEAPFVGHHRFRDGNGERAPAPTHAVALALGPTTNPMNVPRSAPAPRFAPPRHADPQPPVAPRPRAASAPSPQPLTHVRYTRFSAPPLSEQPTTAITPRGRVPETFSGGASAAGVTQLASRGGAVGSLGVRGRAESRASESWRPEAMSSQVGRAGATPGLAPAAVIPREAWGVRSRSGPDRSGVGVRQR